MSVLQNDHSEGPVAKAIENQTAKLPSDLFLWAAAGSMAASATLKCLGKDKSALFVGQWAAPFLLLGIYNKIVKVEGSDRKTKRKALSYTGKINEEISGPQYKGPGQGKHI